MHPTAAPALRSCDLFCAVVDNYGDIGVCWRLARQLAAEYGLDVRLWVDDLASFSRICPDIDPARERQTARDVEVRRWSAPFPDAAPRDLVIEAFACELPPSFVAAMARRAAPPVWINLEYLSAEDWVEGCHGLASPHPSLPLVKHFFFPGFTPRTGGLLAAGDLAARRDAFQNDAAAQARFWNEIGLEPGRPEETRISVFCYGDNDLDGLLDELSNGPDPVTCVVAQDRTAPLLARWLGIGHAGIAPGQSVVRGALTVHLLPFLEQDDYDRLLWGCDANFVRGEDSFVRAQWAARPMIWNIYPQDEGAHWAKLEAFEGHYLRGLPAAAADAARRLSRAWNDGRPAGAVWANWWRERDLLSSHARAWAAHLRRNGDLAANLVQFCQNRVK